MINLECLCSTADIAPEVNGFAEECWRAGTELRLDFPRGLSPEGHSVLLTQLHHTQGSAALITSHPRCALAALLAQHCQGQGRTEITNPPVGQVWSTLRL